MSESPHTTETYIVKETAEHSGESPPTYPTSNISKDPSHDDWRIQLLGSKSSAIFPVKSHCNDGSVDPLHPLNKLLEIRLSRSASIRSRDRVICGVRVPALFGVLLKGGGLENTMANLVGRCLYIRQNTRGRMIRYPTPEASPIVSTTQTFIVNKDITRRLHTYTRNTCRKAIRQCWKVTG